MIRPILVAPFSWSVALFALKGTAEIFLDQVEKFMDDLWREFPNPVKMLDVVVNFTTGLPGLIVSAPITGVEFMIVDLLRRAKVANRLMTVEQAYRLPFEAHKEFIRNVTFTDNTGLAALLATMVGRFIWRLGKKIKLLLLLMRAKTEDQVIRIFIRAFQGKIKFLRVVAMVLAGVMAIEFVGFVFFCIGLFLLLSEPGEFINRILPQDSKRKRMNFRRREVRVNARRGPDLKTG